MTARPPFVLLDDASAGQAGLALYTRPRGEIAARAPDEVPAALAALETARAAGHHLAGYFAYELGLVLEPTPGAAVCRRPGRHRCCGSAFSRRPKSLKGEAADAALAARVSGRAYAGPLAARMEPAGLCPSLRPHP